MLFCLHISDRSSCDFAQGSSVPRYLIFEGTRYKTTFSRGKVRCMQAFVNTFNIMDYKRSRGSYLLLVDTSNSYDFSMSGSGKRKRAREREGGREGDRPRRVLHAAHKIYMHTHPRSLSRTCKIVPGGFSGVARAIEDVC